MYVSSNPERCAAAADHAAADFSPVVAGPELAVAGVAEARDDVALLVEAPIERRAVDLDVRVGGLDRGDALRGGDEVDELDPDGLDGAPLFRTSIAAVAEPPVASIGSRMRHRSTDAESGSLL